MTKEQIQVVIDKYYDLLDGRSEDGKMLVVGTYVPHRANTSIKHGTSVSGLPHDALCHVMWMLDQMKLMLVHDDWGDSEVQGKMYRWLGFVQGVLWCAGKKSIDEMRDDNRS